jgi:hypothetical protein
LVRLNDVVGTVVMVGIEIVETGMVLRLEDHLGHQQYYKTWTMRRAMVLVDHHAQDYLLSRHRRSSFCKSSLRSELV